MRHPAGTAVPALVAKITAATDATRVTGLHIIALTKTGEGRSDLSPRKWTRGRKQGGVVRLVEDAEITQGLGVCEGIETGVAILRGGWSPIWACLDAGNLEALPILPPLALTVFADPDPRGLAAAERLAARWHGAGLAAVIEAAPVPSGGEG